MPTQKDSDRDGLSDELEQRLLEQFAPVFMIARHDCANEPGEFAAGVADPTVERENGTIYGQVSPHEQVFPHGHVSPHGLASPAKGRESLATTPGGDVSLVEIHYYHLWRKDCGPRGHDLDTEHVAVLVRATQSDAVTAKWTALYWYAAAHEDTVCDVSQIARASTVHAQDHGAKVWVSAGKHASYLNEELCGRGCGADRCEDMVALQVAAIVNLGEAGRPMNGTVFVSSGRWPLMEKMESTNFPAPAVARVEGLPETDIAWFRPGRHPAQGVIAAGGSTQSAIARGGQDTDGAIAAAGNSTDVALSLAEDSTGNALGKSYRKTKHALGAATRGVGKALGIAPEK